MLRSKIPGKNLLKGPCRSKLFKCLEVAYYMYIFLVPVTHHRNKFCTHNFSLQ